MFLSSENLTFAKEIDFSCVELSTSCTFRPFDPFCNTEKHICTYVLYTELMNIILMHRSIGPELSGKLRLHDTYVLEFHVHVYI